MQNKAESLDERSSYSNTHKSQGESSGSFPQWAERLIPSPCFLQSSNSVVTQVTLNGNNENYFTNLLTTSEK